MEKDKKYNIVLGIMIFLFILVVGVCIAWGLGIIGLKSDQVETNNENSNVQNNEVQNKVEEITNLEKVSIEEYIGKIYYYMVNNRMPNFDNIDEANEDWVWDVAFKQCNNENVLKSQVIAEAKEIFGNDYNKVPDEDSLVDAYWNEEGGYYVQKAHGMMVDTEACYLIKEIKKENNKYSAELIEYSLNVEEILKGTENAQKKIISGEEVLKSVPEDTSKEEIERYIRENSDKFDSRVLELEEMDGKIYIVSCKNK